MQPDEQQHVETHDPTPKDEEARNAALARYDAHPGIAVILLAVMAFLFIVVAYQLVSDRVDNPELSSHMERPVKTGP